MRITREKENTSEKVPVFQAEKRKTFKELDFRQKISFIWDYYKWWIAGFILLIIVAANTIPTMIENSKEVALYAVFVNTEIANPDSTDIIDHFIKEKDIDIENKRTVLDTSLIINRNRGDQFSMQCNQKMLALFASNEPDILLCDVDNYDFYAENGCFASLEDVLPKELFEKYKPYMLTCSSSDDQTIYYGINVKTSKVLADERAYKIEPVFSICSKVNQPENAIKFLEFLMEEEIETK